MRSTIAGTLLLVLGVAFGGSVQAQEHEGHEQHARNKLRSHGGVLTMTKEHRFEVVFLVDGLRIYGYDAKQEPIDLQDVTGSVTLNFTEEDRKPIEASLGYVAPEKKKGHKKATGHGGHGGHHSESPSSSGSVGDASGGYLSASIALAKVQDGQAQAKIQLKGLPGDKEKEASLRVTYRLARLIEYACPMSCTEPAAKAGACPKCGMALVEQEYVYTCSMHPAVTSRDKDQDCWLCGMEMVKAVSSPDEGKEGQGSGKDSAKTKGGCCEHGH